MEERNIYKEKMLEVFMKKGMNKLFVFVLLGLFLFSSVGFVVGQFDYGGEMGDADAVPSSADAKVAGENVNVAGRSLIAFLKAAIGIKGESSLDALPYLFMGLVLFLFIFSIFQTMDFFSGKEATKNVLSGLASFGVTMLALIALPEGFFSVILPSYGAMGGAILTVIPFLMMFWFSVKVKSFTFARIIWFLFAVYYMGYYFIMFLGKNTSLTTAVTQDAGLAWMYLVMGIVGGIMAIAIGSFRGWFMKGETEEFAANVIRGSKITSASLTSLAEEANAREKAAEKASK